MRYRSNRGFTLLELMLVLLIMGLALSMAIVSTVRTHEKTILREEARRVKSVLDHAREVSLVQRMPVVFFIDDYRGSFWLEMGGKPLSSEQVLPHEIKIEGDEIVFMPKGDSTGGTVKVTDRRKKGFYIEVDPVTGAAEIRRLQPS